MCVATLVTGAPRCYIGYYLDYWLYCAFHFNWRSKTLIWVCFGCEMHSPASATDMNNAGSFDVVWSQGVIIPSTLWTARSSFSSWLRKGRGKRSRRRRPPWNGNRGWRLQPRDWLIPMWRRTNLTKSTEDIGVLILILTKMPRRKRRGENTGSTSGANTQKSIDGGLDLKQKRKTMKVAPMTVERGALIGSEIGSTTRINQVC